LFHCYCYILICIYSVLLNSILFNIIYIIKKNPSGKIPVNPSNNPDTNPIKPTNIVLSI